MNRILFWNEFLFYWRFDSFSYKWHKVRSRWFLDTIFSQTVFGCFLGGQEVRKPSSPHTSWECGINENVWSICKLANLSNESILLNWSFKLFVYSSNSPMCTNVSTLGTTVSDLEWMVSSLMNSSLLFSSLQSWKSDMTIDGRK